MSDAPNLAKMPDENSLRPCEECGKGIKDGESFECHGCGAGCGKHTWPKEDGSNSNWHLCFECGDRKFTAHCQHCDDCGQETAVGCKFCRPICECCGIRYCECCSKNEEDVDPEEDDEFMHFFEERECGHTTCRLKYTYCRDNNDNNNVNMIYSEKAAECILCLSEPEPGHCFVRYI